MSEDILSAWAALSDTLREAETETLSDSDAALSELAKEVDSCPLTTALLDADCLSTTEWLSLSEAELLTELLPTSEALALAEVLLDTDKLSTSE